MRYLGSWVVMGAWAALAAGCGADTPKPPSPPPSASLEPPPTPVAEAPFQQEIAAGGPTFGPEDVELVLDHPELSTVQSRLAMGDAREAAAAMESRWFRGPAEERALWAMQRAYLLERADMPHAAVAAYADAASQGGNLVGHAHLFAARIAVELRDGELALSHLEGVPESLAALALQTRFEAQLLQGDLDAAGRSLDGLLTSGDRPSEWVTLALRYAKARLSTVGPEHAAEAARVAIFIEHNAPSGKGADDARAMAKDAQSLLSLEARKPFSDPPMAERIARIEGLVDARQAQRAAGLSDQLIKRPDAPTEGALGCRLYLARGKALWRIDRHAESSDAYGVAIDACTEDEDRAAALLAGGRAAFRGGFAEEAERRLAALEDELPQHSYADDARHLRVESRLGKGDEAGAAALILSAPSAYPDGDMVGDMLFDLALHRLSDGRLDEAMEPLQLGLERPKERAYYRAGRFPYYAGRVLVSLGREAEGQAHLERAIVDHPLSFYMALAASRLELMSPGQGHRLVAERLAAEPAGEFRVPHHELMDTPAFEQAVELARIGHAQAAADAFRDLGVMHHTAPEPVQWMAVFALSKAGAIRSSHGILRSSTATEPAPGQQVPLRWLDHYPRGAWKQAWELAFPQPYADLVAAEAQRNDVPEALVYAVMREESAFQPSVASHAGAHGLMQLILPTAASMAKPLGLEHDVTALQEPSVNIALGTRFLGILRTRFAENPTLAIPAYNAGPGRPERWIKEDPQAAFDLWVENIPYRETRQYTKRVLTSALAYGFLYGAWEGCDGLRLPELTSERAAAEAARDEEATPASDSG